MALCPTVEDPIDVRQSMVDEAGVSVTRDGLTAPLQDCHAFCGLNHLHKTPRHVILTHDKSPQSLFVNSALPHSRQGMPKTTNPVAGMKDRKTQHTKLTGHSLIANAAPLPDKVCPKQQTLLQASHKKR